jgi:hypothetical protein
VADARFDKTASGGQSSGGREKGDLAMTNKEHPVTRAEILFLIQG